MAIVQALNEEGRTIILITHEADIAAHARRVIHMRDGRITSDEPVRDRRIAAAAAAGAHP